jgi:hypothetical protein
LNEHYLDVEKYYLVDSRYLNEYGYLGPYRGERYHLPEFHRRGQLQSREEIFNRVHSSLRYVIERTFGVWNKRWRILQKCLCFLTKHKFKLLSYQWYYITTFEGNRSKMLHLTSLIDILILFLMIF